MTLSLAQLVPMGFELHGISLDFETTVIFSFSGVGCAMQLLLLCILTGKRVSKTSIAIC